MILSVPQHEQPTFIIRFGFIINAPLSIKKKLTSFLMIFTLLHFILPKQARKKRIDFFKNSSISAHVSRKLYYDRIRSFQFSDCPCESQTPRFIIFQEQFISSIVKINHVSIKLIFFFSQNNFKMENTLVMICYRKHLLKDQKYNVTIEGNSLRLSQVYYNNYVQQENNVAKYALELSLKNHIQWQIEKESNILVAFGFTQDNKFKWFHACEEDLLKLKQVLANRIFYKQVSDFMFAQRMLGKGSSSQVFLVTIKCNKSNEQKFFASKCVDKQYLLKDPDDGVVTIFFYNKKYISLNKKGLFTEIQNMTELDHPNIIKLHEIYAGDSTYYLILDYLEGQTLHEVIGQSLVGFSLAQIQNILQVFSMAKLFYFFKKANFTWPTISSQDLKPENIIFSKKGSFDNLKIVDLGLATRYDLAVFQYPKCGTPGYVAPEVANLTDYTKLYGPECDIFAVGAILYKLQISFI